MEWFFLALMAPIVWATGNHIDSFLVKSFIKEENDENSHSVGSLIIISCLVGLVLLPVCTLIEPQIFSVPVKLKIILMAVGILEGLSILAYLYAVMEDDIASVVAWFNAIPVFNLFLGFIILGEKITNLQAVGFFIVTTGLCILSVKRTELGLMLKKKVVLLMLFSSFAYSAMTVLFKFSTETDSFWVSSFWQYVGLTVLGAIFFIFIKPYRESFIKIFKSRGATFYGINMVNEFLFISGTMVSNYASLLAPVALVSLVGSFQPLIVLFFAFVVGLFVSRKNTEKTTLRDRLIQIFGIFLTIAGLPFIL